MSTDLNMQPTDTPILPAHIEATVQAIAKLHSEHLRAATPSERVVRRVTHVVARPSFLGGLTLALALWVVGNLAAQKIGYRPLDAPPFPWMEAVASIGALYTTAVILSTQSRDDKLSSLREQLTLELAILSEQKTAKTIQLLEEMRRDHPNLPDRVDDEAAAMGLAADPQSVLQAIRNNQAEAERADAAGGADDVVVIAKMPTDPLGRSSIAGFRLYFMDAGGNVNSAIKLDCADIARCLEAAPTLCDGRPMELWEGSRIVARFSADGNLAFG